ncbi:MAG: hypothetical protein AAFR81_29410 [Chloroflexota bacterium]
MANNLQLVSQAEQEQSPREDYVAYQTAARRQRKMIFYDGNLHLIGMPSYSYYVDAYSSNDGNLWLTFSMTVYRIKGRHITRELLPLLQDDRVKSLYCYNPLRHNDVDDDAMVIEAITRHTVQELMSVRDE